MLFFGKKKAFEKLKQNLDYPISTDKLLKFNKF